ncbi:MAG: thiamine pyrophosphate-dependent dehydrogenase E1 component subunit alpha [Actinobacteria bacterium]|nr:thiamine pyrophosphate-dependent dehydrogenase E1 component subunit alpha [Actinomycetota bacterium]
MGERGEGTVGIDEQLELLRRMLEIRLFEDECQRLFARGEVRGSTHLYQGQEAVAVGACSALREGDTMTCTYRGHGATLAMGAPLAPTFGEIFGKANGLCRGKGGSMHLTDLRVGALGSHAIVGAHLPIANGAAFAALYRGTGGVHLCFFGDGSTNIGGFHEALNLASLWKLPVIFVCENNLYGEYSPIASTTPVEHLYERGASYAMRSLQVDGNEVLGVRATVAEAAGRARGGEGPTLIEALTYRQRGHSRTDPATYRPEGELEKWLQRDPILLAERALAGQGVDERRLGAVREEAEQAVAAALEESLSWPQPDPESRFEDVWAR